MKEKITLTDPTGNREEYEVVCHFKVVDNNHPNIKNIPILVVDTRKENNGNKVLGFFWEKDGLYQAITDDTAWSETKSIIIDIIKNNSQSELDFMSSLEVSKAGGGSRELAVNPNQILSLQANTEAMKQAKANAVQPEAIPVAESAPDNTVSPIMPGMEGAAVVPNATAVTVEPVVDNNVIESTVAPVNDATMNVIAEQGVTSPVVDNSVPINEVPLENTVVNEVPTMESNNVINQGVVNAAPVVDMNIQDPVVSDIPVINETPAVDTTSIPTSEPVISEVSVPDISAVSPIVEPVASEPINIEPVMTLEQPQTPVINEEPVIDIGGINETPVVDAPVIIPEPVVNQAEPVIADVQAVGNSEPVVEEQPNNIINFAEEMAKIDNEFKNEVNEALARKEEKQQALYVKYNEQFENQKKKIEEISVAAKEHLENARAAEQIATVAFNNAQQVMQNESPVIEMPTNDPVLSLSKAA